MSGKSVLADLAYLSNLLISFISYTDLWKLIFGLLFQICRDECDVLEYDLCHKELAIVRDQPMLSHQLVLPDCGSLPVIGSSSGLPTCFALFLRNFEEHCQERRISLSNVRMVPLSYPREPFLDWVQGVGLVHGVNTRTLSLIWWNPSARSALF